MDKCDLGLNLNRKNIRSKIKTLRSVYMVEKWPLDTLKKKFIELVSNIIPLNTVIDSVDIAAEEIYNALGKSIVNLNESFFSKTNISNFITGINLGLVTVDNFEASAELASVQEKEQVLLRRNITALFLDTAYGMVSEARQYALKATSLQLFDVLFINRGSATGLEIGLVKDNLDLNRNIRNYLEQLLKKIVEYLNTAIFNKKLLREQLSLSERSVLDNPKLYEGNTPTEALSILSNLIEQYLSIKTFQTSSDPTGKALVGLRELYKKANNYDNSETDTARLHLDAYNAAVILQNFDSALDVILGNIIDIADVGLKTGKDNKYAINKKTAKLLTTWATTDEIDVSSQADLVTKLAVSTTPIYEWQGNTPVYGKFLEFSDFLYIVGKIKDMAFNTYAISKTIGEVNAYGVFKAPTNEYWNELSPESKAEIARLTTARKKPISLSTLINLIRRNPRKYTGIVFDLLSKQSFLEFSDITSATLSEGDKRVIYSLHKGIFNPRKKSESLYDLASVDGTTDYFSFITLMFDTIFSVSHLLYYRDEDGIMRVRTLISLSINNIGRTIESSINASNSSQSIGNYTNFKNYLNITDQEADKLTFTIPNTDIKVKVGIQLNPVFEENNLPITNFEKFFNNSDILRFLDLKLGLNLEDDIELRNLLIRRYGGKSNTIQLLLSFASRIVLNLTIIHDSIDPLETVAEKEEAISKLFRDDSNIKYNRLLDIIEVISASDIINLKFIARAKADSLGVTTATQTRDGEGNNQSMLTTSRLLGSHLSLFELIERRSDSATRDSLILTNPGLYEGVYTSKEYYDRLEGSKSFVDMCVSEFAYSSFILDYVGGLVIREDTNYLVGNNHVMFIPSVNSDKSIIDKIKIDLNTAVKTRDGSMKALSLFTGPELRWLIAQQLGTTNTRRYEAIKEDFDKLLKYITETLSIPLPLNLGLSYLTDFKDFNEWWYLNLDSLKEYGNSPTEFIKEVTLRYNEAHRLEPITLIDLSHFKVQELVIRIGNDDIKIKNALAANLVLISLIARYNPAYLTEKGINISNYVNSVTFWELKRREVLKSLLKSKFRVGTTASTLPELVKLREDYPDWINASGDLILAKVVIDGVEYKIASAKDLIRFKSLKLADGSFIDVDISDVDLIDKMPNILLNPAIENWNYLHYLFTQEFMDCTVGSFINHPEKSKGDSESAIRIKHEKSGTDPSAELLDRVLRREAAQFLALHKRNVSFTASMHEFQLNLLNGIPEEYNIAVIEDIIDHLGTITGTINDIKPFDGATFVNPFVVLLENYSLGGASAGITKKQFVHFKDARTGTGGIIKTCGFGLTNDWIRNSPFLLLMMRKMTDHVWLLEETNADGTHIPALVNITRNYRGENITYKNKYFEYKGKVYEITSIQSLGNNQYRRVLREVKRDTSGNPIVGSYIGEELIISKDGNLYKNNECSDDWVRQNTEVINTNYKLWQFFGGDRSMSVTENGKYLLYSNSSVENVVLAMNNTACLDLQGNIITRNGASKIETLDDLWLPLKHVDVHYVPTAGAVKLGSANINSSSRYTDDIAYNIYRIKMYLSGILLDKEHHADDAELSLMTLVISACAAKGYTFEAATKLYEALRRATEIGTRKHLEAVKQYVTSGDVTGVLEAMYEAIINALGTSNTNETNFAYLVASDLIRQAREGVKIKFSEVALPLSDKTVFRKMFSVTASYLTNAGIKLKIPGILSVLTPSHTIFRVYAGKKLEAYIDPRKELAEELLKLDLTPVFTATVDIPIFLKLGEITRSVDTLDTSDLTLVRYRLVEKPWKDDPTKINQAVRVYIKGSENKGYFEVVKDFESGFYSLHFKPTDANNPNAFTDAEKELLFNTVAKMIPNGAYISTYGTISKGGIHGLLRFANLGFSQVGTRTVLYKQDNNNTISNINLGRTYKITRNVILEIINPDKTVSYVTEPQVFWELINTPLDYLHLKDDINSGVVTNVVEAVIDKLGNPLGRDLAAYNVRFQSTDGLIFLLWDLDSALALFRIGEIKKDKSLSEEDKIARLLQVSEKIFPNRTIDTDKLEVLVRRMLLKDLMNLSSTTPNVLSQYDALLESRTTYRPSTRESSIVYKWSNTAVNSYEVSTAGDRRFSALNARFKDGTVFMGVDISGKTIEDVYLTVVKKSSKGRPPAKDSIVYNPNLITSQEQEDFSYVNGYLPLWKLWASQNLPKIEELRNLVKGKVLTDKFATTRVSQARALADILTLTDGPNDSIYAEDRILDPTINTVLNKLGVKLRTAILSFPLGDFQGITEQLRLELVDKWFNAVDKLTQKLYLLLARILGVEEIGALSEYDPVCISYYLRTGRFYMEDYKAEVNSRINTYKAQLEKDGRKDTITRELYQLEINKIKKDITLELNTVARKLASYTYYSIPGIIDNFLIESNVSLEKAWYDRYAQWVNIYLGTGDGSELELVFNSPLLNLVITNNANETYNTALQIGGIDTLRHPDANGMHFGNPFSHTNYNGVHKVFPTVKEAVIAYEQWLRGEVYQEVEPERRLWILNLINSGNLDGKPLVYYTDTVPDNSYGVSTYNYETAPNHAHVLLKLILEHNPNLGIKHTERVSVTPLNFSTIQPLVRLLIQDTTLVRIGGNLLTIDKLKVKVEPYEIIMPKVFATKFGLRPFDSVQEIVEYPYWFVERYRENNKVTVNSNNYTLALKNSNGLHTILLSRGLLDSVQGLTKVNRDNIGIMLVDSKTVRVDSKGNIMYEVPEDFDLYIDSLGEEIIVTDDFKFFLNNTSFDSFLFSEVLLNKPRIFEKTLNDIKESSNKTATYIYRFLHFNEKNHNFDEVYNNCLSYDLIPENDGSSRFTDNKLVRSLREKHSSFVKSLDVMAARIPSQSMQSFMPMKVIAFDNPDINTAHVSTLLILLLGSDYDVDAVSIATYDVDRNGKLPLWSPYANLESVENLEESLKLPFPTSQEITFGKTSDYKSILEFIRKYSPILEINVIQDVIKDKLNNIVEINTSETEVDVHFKDRVDPQDILMISEFLREVLDLKTPNLNLREKFAKELNIQGFTSKHVDSLFTGIKLLVDKHNLYLDTVSTYRLSAIVNNSTMDNTYKVGINPSNLMLAHTSVDATTGPLKDIADNSNEATDVIYRTAGNCVNMFEGINENQTGKKGISICATGLKSFFGITHYCNFVLNTGSIEDLRRLLIGSDHRGITIGGKTYYTLANIRAIDINTIKNSELFAALSKITQDEDVALTLSALLSLATDNAKELALSKLNAGTKMLGMYIYGLSIGMEFEDIANILMSPVGNVLKNMLDEDKFSGRTGFTTISSGVFDYFTKGPFRQLQKYDRSRDSNNFRLSVSPLLALENYLNEGVEEKDRRNVTDWLVETALNSKPLVQKITLLEKLRKRYLGRTSDSGYSQESIELYNLLIDFALDYILQADVIWKNLSTFMDIQELARGALEMKIMGLVLGLNLGIKTATGDYIVLINNLRRAIYNKTNDIKDIVDLTRFVYDEEYREEIIDKYEKVKTAYNIFDVVSKVPHFMGYLETLVASNVEVNNAFTFRSADNLLLPLKDQVGKYVKEDRLFQGIVDFCGDYLIRRWMSLSDILIIVPAGNLAFDKNGNLYTLTEDRVLHLGNDADNATFRLWMENTVIPDLKEGRIAPGKSWPKISQNRFVRDLRNDVVNKTVSRNSTILYTLPINMIPSTDIERGLFNQYKSLFNALAEDSYLYELHRYVTRENGEIVKETYKSLPLSITDLFTYYSMLAHGWKLNLSSLVSITEDFLNTGIILDYHNYITNIDKSGFMLSMDSIILDEILPYIAPSENPYTSSSDIIISRNPRTMKRELMYRIQADELFADAEEDRIGNYSPSNTSVNTRFFTTTKISPGIELLTIHINLKGTSHKIPIRYDLNTEEFTSVNVPIAIKDVENPSLYVLDLLNAELKTVPMIKADSARIPDMQLLQMCIDNIINKCE